MSIRRVISVLATAMPILSLAVSLYVFAYAEISSARIKAYSALSGATMNAQLLSEEVESRDAFDQATEVLRQAEKEIQRGESSHWPFTKYQSYQRAKELAGSVNEIVVNGLRESPWPSVYPDIRTYDCFQDALVFPYSDSDVLWYDIVREGKLVDGVVLPWVISVRQSDTRGYDSGRPQIVCVLPEEVPGYGRGPHFVSEAVFVPAD